MKLYYYDETEMKQGPFESDVIRKLAREGGIHRNTILELETGQRRKAANVWWIRFSEISNSNAGIPVSIPVMMPVTDSAAEPDEESAPIIIEMNPNPVPAQEDNDAVVVNETVVIRDAGMTNDVVINNDAAETKVVVIRNDTVDNDVVDNDVVDNDSSVNGAEINDAPAAAGVKDTAEINDAPVAVDVNNAVETSASGAVDVNDSTAASDASEMPESAAVEKAGAVKQSVEINEAAETKKSAEITVAAGAEAAVEVKKAAAAKETAVPNKTAVPNNPVAPRKAAVSKKSVVNNNAVVNCIKALPRLIVFLGISVIIAAAGGAAAAILNDEALFLIPAAAGIFAFVIMLAAVIQCYRFLYYAWKLIPEDIARTKPYKAVGYLWIPFFSFYWEFTAVLGLAEDMNKTLEQRGLKTRVQESTCMIFCLLSIWLLCPGVNAAVLFLMLYYTYAGFRELQKGVTALVKGKDVK